MNFQKTYNIPIFIPHEGCPHTCIFCNQTKITGVQTRVTCDDVRKIISDRLSYLPKNGCRIEAAFFGGSFTGLDLELQEKFLKTASEFSDRLDGIRMSTRPDYINKDVLTLAKKYNVRTIELGMQSSDNEVLRLNERGHRFEDTAAAAALISEYKISLGVQVMVGMYGSTPEKDVLTAADAASLNPECARIYPTLTLCGTKLDDLYRQGRYAPYDMETALTVTDKMMRIFEERRIEIIRVGLHSDESLTGGDGICAGPYHPAFRELVLSRRERNRIETEILRLGLKNCVYEAHVPCDMVSVTIGHKRCNAEYFRRKYNIILKAVSS